MCVIISVWGLTCKVFCVYTPSAFCRKLDKMRIAWSIAKFFTASHVNIEKENRYRQARGYNCS